MIHSMLLCYLYKFQKEEVSFVLNKQLKTNNKVWIKFEYEYDKEFSLKK